ncbi:hypothetical protein [Microbulbifer sp. 2205BS26-8]|uniref:hypothetical protein n=1 Tax=Microbulbifer sp. 2205BS26-8 TaxID=3064386 RepID=UPI0026308131|nr:hypothetical protein [Microbulbifer sp. 2205BS26-8]MDP5208865.1 hypothetical protein [Microbulbifer sp. 2205BS26-8]
MQNINVKLDLTKVVAIQDAKLQGVCVALISLILELCKTEVVDRENLYKRLSLAINKPSKLEHSEEVNKYIKVIRTFISPDQKATEGEVIGFPEPAPESP